MQIPDLIVGLDFETYFDQDYTLRKLSTSEYIRDRRFKDHMVALRTNKEKSARWYAHEEIHEVLSKDFDWSKTGMLAHHCQFDGLIASHHHGIIPAYYLCTMSMARPLVGNEIGASLDAVASHYRVGNKLPDILGKTKGVYDLPPDLLEQLGEYNIQDVNIMWDIFHIMREHIPDDEMDLIHLTVNMFANPVLKVDRKRAQAELDRELRAKRKAINKCAKYLNTKKRTADQTYDATMDALRKDTLLVDAFRQQGVEPPTKYSAKQKKMIPAFAKTDIPFQALALHDNQAVRDLYEARQVAKSTNAQTRAERLLDHSRPPFALPIYLNYAKAHTLRWSGGDKMNPQNFQRGSELRKSIIAPRGQQVVVVDSSQIEARVVLWLAGQTDQLEAFADPNRDPYCEMAEEIYHRVVTKKQHPEERFVGKVAKLGLGFQMGAPKFQYTLEAGVMGPPVKLDLSTCEKAVQSFRRVNHKVVNLWRVMQQMLTVMMTGNEYNYRDIVKFEDSRVLLPNGMYLWYDNLSAAYDAYHDEYTDFRYGTGKGTKIYGGLLTENIVQALARIIVAQQMLRIAEHYRVVTMTHDEVVYLAPTRKAKEALEYGLEVFRTPPQWCSDLPTDGEGGYAPNYSK